MPPTEQAWQQAIEEIGRAQRIGIVGHVRPDGDALGSMIALIKADPDGANECKTLAKAHRSVAVKFANDRKGYIKRNGSKKWKRCAFD